MRKIKTAGANGFTIIEMIVTVAVIAILTSITAVGYNGMQRASAETGLKSDLNNAFIALGKNDGLSLNGFTASNSNSITGPKINGAGAFCLDGVNSKYPTMVWSVTKLNGTTTSNCTTLGYTLTPPGFTAQTQTAYSQLPRPLGWWKMNGDMTDYSGNGNNGYVYNGPTSIADKNGNNNSAYSFNGSNQWNGIDNFGQKLGGKKNITLSGWVKPNANPSNHEGYFGLRVNGGPQENSNFYFLQLANSTNIEARFIDSTVTVPYDVPNMTVTLGQWQLLTMTYDGTTLKGYINGVLVGSKPASGVMGSNNATFFIGRDSTYLTTASIDDVRIYDTTLSDAQVSTLFSGGPDASPTTLAGQWKFNGNLADTGYGGNNGISNGITPTIGYTGAANNAYQFGYNTDMSSASKGLPVGTSSRTVMAWVYLTSYDSMWSMVDTYGNRGATGAASALAINGPGYVSFAGSGADFISTLKLNLNEWHLIGYSLNGTASATVYLDNQSQTGTVSSNATLVTTGSTTHNIGKWGDSSFFTRGKIDQVEIYNGVLTSAQIATLFSTKPILVSPANTPTQTTPVAWYQFNNSWEDSGPSKLNAATVGSPGFTTNRGGTPNSAAYFDGASYLTLPNAVAASGNNAYAMSAWVRNSGRYAQGIVGWGTFNSNNSSNVLRIFGDGTGSVINYWWANDLYPPQNQPNILDDRWHHVLAQYDGPTPGATNTRSIWIDGVKAAQDNPASPRTSPAANATIGSSEGNQELYKGSIDDVRIYNTALSDTAIRALFQAGPQ